MTEWLLLLLDRIIPLVPAGPDTHRTSTQATKASVRRADAHLGKSGRSEGFKILKESSHGCPAVLIRTPKEMGAA